MITNSKATIVWRPDSKVGRNFAEQHWEDSRRGLIVRNALGAAGGRADFDPWGRSDKLYYIFSDTTYTKASVDRLQKDVYEVTLSEPEDIFIPPYILRGPREDRLQPIEVFVNMSQDDLETGKVVDPVPDQGSNQDEAVLLTWKPESHIKKWAMRVGNEYSKIRNVVSGAGGYVASAMPPHRHLGDVWLYERQVYAEAELLDSDGGEYRVKLSRPVDVPFEGTARNPGVKDPFPGYTQTPAGGEPFPGGDS